MLLRKVPVGLLAPGPLALAWTDRKGTIWYRVAGRRRFAHEAAHNLRNEGNKLLHHHGSHFCVLVGHAVRLNDDCATDEELRAGEILLAAPDNTWTEVADNAA